MDEADVKDHAEKPQRYVRKNTSSHLVQKWREENKFSLLDTDTLYLLSLFLMSAQQVLT